MSLRIANLVAETPIFGTLFETFLREMFPKIGGHVMGKHFPKRIYSAPYPKASRDTEHIRQAISVPLSKFLARAVPVQATVV